MLRMAMRPRRRSPMTILEIGTRPIPVPHVPTRPPPYCIDFIERVGIFASYQRPHQCHPKLADGAMNAARSSLVDEKTFSLVAGIIFALVALVHLVRIFMEWPVMIDD